MRPHPTPPFLPPQPPHALPQGTAVINCSSLVADNSACERTPALKSKSFGFFSPKPPGDGGSGAAVGRTYQTRLDQELLRNGVGQGRLRGLIEVEFREVDTENTRRESVTSTRRMASGGGGCCSIT